MKRRQPKGTPSTAASTTTTTAAKSRQNKEAAELARTQARERLKAAKRQYMLAHKAEAKAAAAAAAATTPDQPNGQAATFLVL